MNSNSASFRLTEQPWIPVVDSHGRSRDVSLIQLFEQARQVTDLDVLPADQLIGIRNLLLGICYQAGVAPTGREQWMEMSKAGIDTAPVVTWLKGNTQRFDLFDPDRPFFQRAALVALISGDPDLVESTSWLFNGSAGDGQMHYNDRTADAAAISPALAARLLVAKQAVGRGGPEKGKNDIAKALGDPSSNSKWAWSYTRVVVAAIGPNLAQTLALNLVPEPVGVTGDDDTKSTKPKDTINLSWDDRHRKVNVQRSAAGYADALTFQSRSLALTHAVNGTGQVLVTGSKVAPGESFLVTSDGDKRATPSELPWLAWSEVTDPKTGGTLLTAGKCAWSTRSLWRDQHAWFAYAASGKTATGNHGLLELLGELDEQTLTLEFAGAEDQGNKIVAMAVERTTIPTKVLESLFVVGMLTRAVTFASGVHGALRKHVSDVARDMNVRAPKGVLAAVANQASTLLWATLDHHYQELLTGLSADHLAATTALENWIDAVDDAALNSFDAATETLPKRDGLTYKFVVNQRFFLGEDINKIKTG